MFDFMNGNIEIVLQKEDYMPNEKIEGTVRMTIKKAIKARGVRVELKATRIEGGGQHQRTVILHHEEKQLDKEKEYRPQPYEYRFDFAVPDLKLWKPGFQGFFGGMLNAITRPNPVRWAVTANLDIPMGIDVSATRKITVKELLASVPDSIPVQPSKPSG